MDSSYARGNVRRAIVVNRGRGIPTALVAPMAASPQPAPTHAVMNVAVQQPGWHGLRPAMLLLQPSCGYSAEPAAPSSAVPPPRLALEPPPAPAPRPVSSPRAMWSWKSVAESLQEDLLQGGLQQRRMLQRLPSFGERTAAASTSSEMAGSSGSGSLASAALSSSPPSPPHARTFTDSSDVDEFTALALKRLHESTGGAMQPSPSSCNDGDQSMQHVAFELGSSSRTPRKKIGNRKSGMFCAFCRGNGELPRMFTSHLLHLEMSDGSIIVACPVLRRLRCELCGASGDVAHTRSHCPYNNQPSVAVLLKNTPRQCDGSLRKKIRDRK